jgi:hypothetical protein
VRDDRNLIPPLSEEPAVAFSLPGRIRFEAEESALLLGCQHVEETVRPLTYVAYALLQLRQQWLASELLPTFVENYPPQSSPRNAALSETADKGVPFPARESIAGIERHSRKPNGWQPHNDRRFHAGARRTQRDLTSR